MEADWEFEIGAGADEVLAAPVIEAHWPGFVDLRQSPSRAWDLPETVQFPALAEALAKLNSAASPLWTSKCDLWDHLDPGEFDADELDAPSGHATHAMGCYIDLLPKSDQQWPTPVAAAADCKRVCKLLRAVPLRCCRADLVVRRAFITPDLMQLGITVYLTSCGESLAEAALAFQHALAAFTDVLCAHSTLE
ncbi:MAG: hypothetical protein ABSD72_03065 [Terracidiphilus sp.]|jgi:hypothetical protein